MRRLADKASRRPTIFPSMDRNPTPDSRNLNLPSSIPSPSPLDLLRSIETLSSDSKAIDRVSLDLRRFSSEFGYCHVCSATSGAHMRGICETIEMGLKKRGIPPLGTEGVRDGRWALLDFDHVMVHVIDLDYREELGLEKHYRQRGGLQIESAGNDPVESTEHGSEF